MTDHALERRLDEAGFTRRVVPRILGLDLSLRATGMALVPGGWGLDWSQVTVANIGEGLPKDAPEADRCRRLLKISLRVLEFARDMRATHVFVEQYALTSMASQAHALGELGGVVKTWLHEAGLPLAVVPPASARKLLGKMPRKGAKVAALGVVWKAGAPKTWTDDEADAFVVANYGLTELGCAGLIVEAA